MAAKYSGATLWVKDGWIHVRTPYNRDFVDDLKAGIEARFRAWDPDDKVWKVNPAKDEVLLRIVKKHYGDPTILEDKEIVVVENDGADPYGKLLRLAPDAVLKKCYRLIAAAVHPDAGGTGDQMTQANNAWALIKQDRGW